MKLSTKLLTSISPLVLVGTIVPTVTSCGCSGSNYAINYGDDVNCMNKDAQNYHSIDDVKKAIKDKVQVETDTTTVFSAATINAKIYTQDIPYQNVYYDLIAGYVFNKEEPVWITGWSIGSPSKSWTFKWGESQAQLDNIKFEYQYNQVDNKLHLALSEAIDVLSYTYIDVLSYTYKDCKASG